MNRQKPRSLVEVQEELRSVVEELRACQARLLRLRAKLPPEDGEELEAVARGERPWSLAGALTQAIDGALRDTLAAAIAGLDQAAHETQADLDRQWREQFPPGWGPGDSR